MGVKFSRSKASNKKGSKTSKKGSDKPEDTRDHIAMMGHYGASPAKIINVLSAHSKAQGKAGWVTDERNSWSGQELQGKDFVLQSYVMGGRSMGGALMRMAAKRCAGVVAVVNGDNPDGVTGKYPYQRREIEAVLKTTEERDHVPVLVLVARREKAKPLSPEEEQPEAQLDAAKPKQAPLTIEQAQEVFAEAQYKHPIHFLEWEMDSSNERATLQQGFKWLTDAVNEHRQATHQKEMFSAIF